MPSWLKKITILSIGTALISIVIWYSASFLPHLGELKELSSRGSIVIMDVEDDLYPLAVAGESKNGIRSYVTRSAYYSLVHEDANKSTKLVWHANNILWYGASFIHFNDQEIFGIWAQCALAGCGHGLNEIAQRYFGKKLMYFSEKELASLVAVIRNPTYFAPDTEVNNQRANEILDKTMTHWD